MKSSVIYRSPYACNNAKNVKPSMQHRTEDNNQQVEDEQTIQAEEWNLPKNLCLINIDCRCTHS